MAMERKLLIDADLDNESLARMVCMATEAAVGSIDVNTMPGGIAEICHALIREQIAYDAEVDTQQIRLPWRLLDDGVGDCKSYAVFVGSICLAAGREVSLRFVRQNGDEHFSHVYAMVDGIPVDPLLPFGCECPHDSRKDVRI